MLHLRLISPTGTTDRVMEVLASDPGVTHVTLARGCAVEPEGDLIQADIAREAANDVVGHLKSLGVDREGGMTLVPVETVLSHAGERAIEEAPGDPSDAVVWEELLAQTHEESSLNSTFLAFLTIACLLAAVGVATDSPVTVVGAMVVGPEFGPLAAFSVGLVRRDKGLVRRSAVALLVAFPVAMAFTLAATLLWEQFGWISLSGVENAQNVDFIYEVGPFSLIVALLAGAAGMLSLVTSKSAALVGVFISVTTVPAAGFAVVAATVGEWDVAFQSAGQLGVNLAGIVVAGVLVLFLRPRAGSDAGPVERFKRWVGMSARVEKVTWVEK